jgi:hypothetical protein
MTHVQPHYQVRPYFGRFAVVYPLPGGQPGDWAALCDFRTEQGAQVHADWLNAGITGHRPQRDPSITALLQRIRTGGSAQASGTPTGQP